METFGASPVTPGNQTTAKKMSFGGRGSPSTRFWGRAAHKFGVSARPPGIPKGGRYDLAVSPTQLLRK